MKSKLLNFKRAYAATIATKELCTVASTSTGSIDSSEVERFAGLSKKWNDEEGPFKALYSMNNVRVPWIMQNLPQRKSDGKRARVVDIGCGGGILSVPLARAGCSVTGIDATAEAVAAAKTVAKSASCNVNGINERLNFEHISAEELAEREKEGFDAVVASEIVEHVSCLSSFIGATARLARPGAPLFFTTINRTLLSKALAIWLAEDVLGVVPQGIHDWEKFVTPCELTKELEINGCRIVSVSGLMYHPIGNRWEWIAPKAVNYGLMAVKL